MLSKLLEKEIMEEILEENLKRVRNGLLVLDKVFNKQAVNYRVLGSILVAALNGKSHRTLGDIDVLVDSHDIEKIIRDLKSEGFEIVHKQKIGFHWIEGHKEDSLGFTFLLVGTFGEKYFSYKLADSIELRISNTYLLPTKYSLMGSTFTGIPLRSIYEGLKISYLNPKRRTDSLVIKKVIKNRLPEGEALEKAFTVYLKGFEVPFAYSLFSRLYNWYGGLRVIFGKKYEIWD